MHARAARKKNASCTNDERGIKTNAEQQNFTVFICVKVKISLKRSHEFLTTYRAIHASNTPRAWQ